MMFANRLTLISILSTWCLSAPVYAQSFFLNSQGHNSFRSSTTPAPNQPMSADDFNARVRSLNQQNQQNMKQQLQAQLPPPPATTGGSNSTAVALPQPNTFNAPTPVTPPAPPPPTSSYSNSAPGASTYPSTTPSFSNSAPAPSSGGQVYTGFQGTNQSTPPPRNQSNTNTSPGWNIKY